MKEEFVTSKLEQGSSKSLFAVMNELVDSKRETVLPVSESGQLLANQFQTFFREKIAKIRTSFVPISDNASLLTGDGNLQVLSKFKPTDVEEITSIVKSFQIKCSPEDPVPVNLLSSSSDTFINFWV